MAQIDPYNADATAELHQIPGREHLSVFNIFGPYGEITGEYIATHARPEVAAGPIGSEPVVPGAPPEDIPVDPIAQLVPTGGYWATHPSDPNWGNPAFMAPEGHPSFQGSPDTWLSIKRDYDQEQYQIQNEADDALAAEAAAPKSSGQPYIPELGFWGNVKAGLGRMVEDAPNVPGRIAESVGEFGRGIAEGIPQGFTSSADGADDDNGDDGGNGGNGGAPPPVNIIEVPEYLQTGEGITPGGDPGHVYTAPWDPDNGDYQAGGGLVKRNPNEYAKGGVVKRKGYSSPQPVGMANGGPLRGPNVTPGMVGRPSLGARTGYGPPNSDLSGVGVNVEFPFGPADASRVESLDILGGSSRGTPPPIDTPASLVQRTDSELVSTAPEEEEEEEVASPPFQADVDIDTGEPPPPNVTNGAYNQNMDDFYMQDGGKVEQTDDTVTLTHDQIKALANKLYSEFEGRQRDFDKGEKYLRFIDVNGNNIPSPRPMADGGPIRVDEESLVDRKPTDTPMPPGTDEEIGVADDLPRNLSEGEFVIPAHVVKHFGENFFNDLIGSVKPPKALMKKKPV